MGMRRVDLFQMNNRQNMWLCTLELYREELAKIDEELNDVSRRASSIELLKQVAHHKNMLHAQLLHIEKLHAEVYKNITDTVIHHAKHQSCSGDHSIVSQHRALEKDVIMQERSVYHLRRSCQRLRYSCESHLI
jgi:hypothetical protein